jgi:MFS family permease
MGIYYIAPLIGPSIGALLGGVLTTGFGWRGPFYFLAIVSGVVLLSFVIFFKDTFRHERSYAYQAILKRRLAEHVTSKKLPPSTEDVTTRGAVVIQQTFETDVEKQVVSQARVADVASDIKLSLMDVNPFKPMAAVIVRRYNYAMLIASGKAHSQYFR